MMLSILLLALAGFIISLYSYRVEQNVRNDPSYRPLCDLSDHVSCSAPIKSPYSRMFQVSNAVVGMAFYLLVALLAFLNMHKTLLALAIMATLGSCVLAYILFFKIRSLCLLCVSVYVINFIILALSLYKVFA